MQVDLYADFFPLNTTTVLHNLWLVKSADVEPRIQSAECKVTCGFLTVFFDPRVVQGSTMLNTNQKKAGIATLISDKIYFSTKNITETKSHFIMLKGSVHHNAITF